MDEYINELFKKDTDNIIDTENDNTNNNSVVNSESDDSDSVNNSVVNSELENTRDIGKLNSANLSNLLERANINLPSSKKYKLVNLYENITRDYANNLAKVVFHRNGDQINMSDTYLLNNILNQNMSGGNYIGYCDNNVGQCSDSFASQGGGSNEFCGGHPTQCSGSTQKGGFIEFCDGHPTQCSGSTQTGGFIEFCGGNPSQCSTQSAGSLSKVEFEKIFKKYTKYRLTKEALDNIHQMVENDLVHYLNKKTSKFQ